MITLANITKSYQTAHVKARVLNNLSLTIQQGEMLAIVGTSGSGKSTLMNVMGLLDRPDTGEYHFQGRDVQTLDDDHLAHLRNRSFGFVFQQFHLLSRMSAIQNIALPLMYRHIPEKEALDQAYTMLSRVNMAGFAQHRPTQLSGGQQQRVAIARALVGDPDVILADEPTGSLDSATSQEIMQLFMTLHQEGRTIIMITHDGQVAARCSRQVTLVDGQI